MLKVFAAYDSKYGNTRIAAEKILEGINEVGEFETAIGDVKEIDIEKLAEYDALILGAPNHMGRPSQTMKKFVNRLSALSLKTKDVAVFGTYSGTARTPDRAVKKLEQMVKKRLPALNLLSPSLSVRVKGIPGPIWEGELPRCVEFGKNIASQIKGH
ncbi:MAG TPA: flavodoxin domain-containing protein [Candidatus Nanoarchaeia archaeon]|nr:flavodoxin domain-containing protein [Candidatus Nanoarchaeia archaeon]